MSISSFLSSGRGRRALVPFLALALGLAGAPDLEACGRPRCRPVLRPIRRCGTCRPARRPLRNVLRGIGAILASVSVGVHIGQALPPRVWQLPPPRPVPYPVPVVVPQPVPVPVVRPVPYPVAQPVPYPVPVVRPVPIPEPKIVVVRDPGRRRGCGHSGCDPWRCKRKGRGKPRVDRDDDDDHRPSRRGCGHSGCDPWRCKRKPSRRHDRDDDDDSIADWGDDPWKYWDDDDDHPRRKGRPNFEGIQY